MDEVTNEHQAESDLDLVESMVLGKPVSTFATETMDAVASVRGALGTFVSQIPGEIRRPRQLQRALGVDYKICWQVFNVIQADDPLTAAKHTPSSSALKRFLTSGLQLGVNQKSVEAVRVAIERFSRVVLTHADDRDTFQSMVAAVAADEGDSAGDLQQRRSVYRTMSQIWGAQTESNLVCGLIRRSPDLKHLQECLFTIRKGFRRLRPNASPIVYGGRDNSDASDDSSHSQIPLDLDAAAKFGAPLVPAFCSNPMPNLRTDRGVAGWIYSRLATEGIGRKSTVDLAFGVSFPEVEPTIDDLDGKQLVRSSITIRTPVALLVMDMLVHRPSFGNITPELIAFQHMPGDESPAVARAAPQLVVHEKIINLGPADRVSSVPEWQRYHEMTAYLGDQLKWDMSEFDVYRARVQFPVFGSNVRMQFKVP